jgi:hypothetical protein
MTTWSFLTDDEYQNNLAELWEAIVAPLRNTSDLPEDDFRQAFEMLKQIASAQTGIGSEIQSHRLTAKALSLKAVVEEFREKQKALETKTEEINAFDEAEKATAKANKTDLTRAEQQAIAWYDNVEKALQGLIKRIQNDETGVFVGGEPSLYMRRLVGAGGMMAITSPATPVKQNMLMTLLGVLVTENSLKEVFEDYITKKGNETKTFSQFLEDIVQLRNHTLFRAVLNKIEEKLSVKEGTGFLLSGAEYRQSEKTTVEATTGKRKPKTLEEKTRTETVLTELLRKEKPDATDVFTEIKPPTINIQEENKAVSVRFKLSKDQEITVNTSEINFSNLRKGILLYLDALATPELGDVDPVTKKPTVYAKWAYSDFMKFYRGTLKAIERAKPKTTKTAGQRLEDLAKAFVEREKLLRFGKQPSTEAKATPTAPIGVQTTFGNAIRDYYITHFGPEATKVKSFGLSVIFNTIADKLGLGSSLLPSVVYDVWINANIHNLLREAETGVNPTGEPNELRLKALQQKYRQALLPYGFDVDFSFDEATRRVNIVVKDFEKGKLYIRENNSIVSNNMKHHDLATFNAINKASKRSPLSKIREEWKQKRMFFASEPTETVQSKAQRLTNLTRVFQRRFGEEWHSIFQTGTEPVGALVLKELENAISHFMNIKYDTDGNVFLLPSHPFYQKIQQSPKNKKLTEMFDGKKEISVEEIFKHGKKGVKAERKSRKLLDLYKDYINRLREGGVPMAFAEQVLMNALYVDPTKPMEPRKLQALLWVCTRGAV